jgi:hypothetical protein
MGAAGNHTASTLRVRHCWLADIAPAFVRHNHAVSWAAGDDPGRLHPARGHSRYHSGTNDSGSRSACFPAFSHESPFQALPVSRWHQRQWQTWTMSGVPVQSIPDLAASASAFHEGPPTNGGSNTRILLNGRSARPQTTQCWAQFSAAHRKRHDRSCDRKATLRAFLEEASDSSIIVTTKLAYLP